MQTVRCSVDRIEGKLAVLISDDDRVFHLNTDKYELHVGDIFDLTIEGDVITSAVCRPEERNSRLESNKKRLSALFAKGKK